MKFCKVILIVAVANIFASAMFSVSAVDPQTPKIITDLDSTINDVPELLNRADSSVMKAVGMDRINTDSAEFARMPWTKQLYKSGFNINATGINYPKFPRFIVNVYNWADRFFNTFDPQYVTGTGKSWKLYFKSYNWIQNYGLYFHKDNYTRVRSDMYNDIGAHLSYKAVSIGYMADVNRLAKGSKEKRKHFEIDFTCALFSANLNIAETKGGSKITHIGNQSLGKNKFDFNGNYEKTINFTAYYFFNNKRYSQGAAYNLSRYQYRSSGSPILGFNINHQRVDLDFGKLNDELNTHFPEGDLLYAFRYNSFNLAGGYGYNWVLRPRTWLINVTVLPMVGYMHSFEGTTEGKKDLFSASAQAMASVVYNHRSFFATLQGNIEGNFMFTRGYTFFNSLSSISLVAGVRF